MSRTFRSFLCFFEFFCVLLRFPSHREPISQLSGRKASPPFYAERVVPPFPVFLVIWESLPCGRDFVFFFLFPEYTDSGAVESPLLCPSFPWLAWFPLLASCSFRLPPEMFPAKRLDSVVLPFPVLPPSFRRLASTPPPFCLCPYICNLALALFRATVLYFFRGVPLPLFFCWPFFAFYLGALGGG